MGRGLRRPGVPNKSEVCSDRRARQGDDRQHSDENPTGHPSAAGTGGTRTPHGRRSGVRYLDVWRYPRTIDARPCRSRRTDALVERNAVTRAPRSIGALPVLERQRRALLPPLSVRYALSDGRRVGNRSDQHPLPFGTRATPNAQLGPPPHSFGGAGSERRSQRAELRPGEALTPGPRLSSERRGRRASRG